MDGRRHRFTQEDFIEVEWRIVEPILDHTDRPSTYYKGTWGPWGAEMQTGGWHDVSVQSPAS
jgi:glucose-6-phosphate 1-dehydrogenase